MEQTIIGNIKDHVIIDIPDEKTLKWSESCKKIQKLADDFTPNTKTYDLRDLKAKLTVELKKLKDCNDKVINHANVINKCCASNSFLNITILCCSNFCLTSLSILGFGASEFFSDDLKVQIPIFAISAIPYVIPTIGDTALKIISNIAERFSDYNTILKEIINQTEYFKEIVIILESIEEKDIDIENRNLLINEAIQKCIALIDQHKMKSQKHKIGGLLSKDQCDRLLSTVVSMIVEKKSNEKKAKGNNDSQSLPEKKNSNEKTLPWTVSYQKIQALTKQLHPNIKEPDLHKLKAQVTVELKKLEGHNSKAIHIAEIINKWFTPNSLINTSIGCFMNCFFTSLAITGFGTSCFATKDLRIKIPVFVASSILYYIPPIGDTTLKIISNITESYTGYQTIRDVAIEETKNFKDIIVNLESLEIDINKENRNLLINEAKQKSSDLINTHKIKSQELKSMELLTKEQCNNLLTTVSAIIEKNSKDQKEGDTENKPTLEKRNSIVKINDNNKHLEKEENTEKQEIKIESIVEENKITNENSKENEVENEKTDTRKIYYLNKDVALWEGETTKFDPTQILDDDLNKIFDNLESEYQIPNGYLKTVLIGGKTLTRTGKILEKKDDSFWNSMKMLWKNMY